MRHSARPAPFGLAAIVLAYLVLPGPLRGQEGAPLPPAPSLASLVPDLFAPPTDLPPLPLTLDPVPTSDPISLLASLSGPSRLESSLDAMLASPEIPPLLDRGGGQGAAPDAPERLPRQLNGKHEGEWGSLTAQVTLPQAPEPLATPNPIPASAWQTNQALRLTMVGPFNVYGNLGTKFDAQMPQSSQVAGQTGLEWKMPVGSGAGFQVRSGPRLTYVDPLRATARSQSDWLLEVQAHCPLVYGVGLEYQGSAIPATGTTQHDQINQDLHLAFPLGSAGKVQVGARQRWQSNTTPQPLTDSMQLYLGLQLTR